MKSLLRRVAARADRARLRLTGERIDGLVSVTAANAAEIAARYPGVTATARVQSDGLSTLVPKSLPEDRTETLRPFRRERETILFDIRNRGFSFRNALLIDPERRAVFADTLTEGEVLAFRRYAPRRCRSVSGTVAYLSNTWVDNYYHWMQLTLPLLELYPRDAVDFYYIGPSRLQAVQVATLERCGIAPDRILREPCRADRLLAAIILARPQGHGMRYRDPWSHAFTRGVFAGATETGGPERLYIRRGAVRSRRITNETDVEALLARHGFVALGMDGRSLADQVSLFAGARMVVGAHGAALTNLLFARPGIRVLELFPPAAQEPGMFVAATHAGADYAFLLGEAAGEGDDFVVPVPKLERALALLDPAAGRASFNRSS